MSPADKIVKLRKDRGWKQQDLCNEIGIHVAHLSRVETGKSQPSVELLHKIAKAFGVTMDYLYSNNDDESLSVSITNKSLADKVSMIEKLSEKDQETIINVIDSMLSKQKMRDFLEQELR